jgi:hypothetical protein
MATIPILNAVDLRKWADAASSYRGGAPFWLVYRDGEEPIIRESESPPDGAVFGVDTREVCDRPKPSSVVIDCDGSNRDLVKAYDALFWSEAAVEKFVIPYYASKSLWEAAAVLDKLSWYWYGEIPPDTDEPGSTDGLPPGSAPYAIAHTPDSDWNTLSLGSDIHLLVRDGLAVRAVRLSDLPDPPPQAERGDRARRTLAATACA